MDQDDSHWASLMAAAQNGDRDSYAQLLRELAPLLRRLARQGWPMASLADIEDVLQETLLTLHAIRHTYDPRRPFMPWLLTLLQRRVADAVRQQARRRKNEIATDPLDVTFLGAAANHEQELPLEHEALKTAIAQLPPAQRQAVELLKQRELSLKQASAATGISVAALKVATHRALKALRAKLTSGKR